MRLKELIRRMQLNRREEFPFPEDVETYVETFVPNVLMKSETLQKAFEVSAYEMEQLYEEAYQFYQEDNTVQAATAFRWLALLNPFVAKYWMGLGASLQLLEKYEKALHAYAVSSLLESENPYPHLHACECYVALSNSEEARKALESALRRTQGKPDYAQLQEELEEMRRSLCRQESLKATP